jgi:hypothetical protein
MQLDARTQEAHEKEAQVSRLLQQGETNALPSGPSVVQETFSHRRWLVALLIAVGAACAWAWLAGYRFGFMPPDDDQGFPTQDPFVCAKAHSEATGAAFACISQSSGQS